MATKPLVGQDDRPDLTVNTADKPAQARDLGTILGSSATTAAKLKELPSTAIDKTIIKEGIKEIVKEHKDQKDSKEQKDHKEPKDHKDSKDTKDQKEHKDPKDSKDQKDQKDPKEHKDQKDQKEHKDPKEHKDQKDVKDHKEFIKENHKELTDVVIKPAVEIGPGPVETLPPDDLTQLIGRVSGLELAVQELMNK